MIRPMMKWGESHSRSLQSGADDHDRGTEDNHALATEGVTDEDGDDGADEAAKVVRSDGDTLGGSTLALESFANAVGFGVDVGELRLECGQSENTTGDTLVWRSNVSMLSLCLWRCKAYRIRKAGNHIRR